MDNAGVDITDSPELSRSERSRGAIHKLAEIMATEYMVDSVSRGAFQSWKLKARHWRRWSIAAEWWHHSTIASALECWRRGARHQSTAAAAHREARVSVASAALAHWFAEARFLRVAAAARRESVWRALGVAIDLWIEFVDIAHAANRLGDDLAGAVFAKGRCVDAMEKWRSHVYGLRVNHLGRLAHEHAAGRRCIHAWSARCADPSFRRVQVDGGRFMSTLNAVSQQHQRQRASITALHVWRLAAMRRQMAALDTVHWQQPAARRALRCWRDEAAGIGWRRYTAIQRAKGSVMLQCALAMRSWRGLALLKPLVMDRLRDERILMTSTLLALDRWKRHTDANLSAFRTDGPRRRRTTRGPIAAAAARHAARLLAQRRAYRTLQILSHEAAFGRLASRHWAAVQSSVVIGQWQELTLESAMRQRMIALGATMATLGSERCALQALLAAANRHACISRVYDLSYRVMLREQRDALFCWWRRVGFAKLPLFQTLKRCHEVARALLLLFVWRDWASWAHEQRSNLALSLMLPLVHALHRWRARADLCRMSAPISSSLTSRARAARLPPAWRAWREVVVGRQQSATRLAGSSQYAARFSISLAMQSWHAALARGRRARGAAKSWASKAMACALREWHASTISDSVWMAHSRMPSVAQRSRSQRASCFSRWALWAHLSKPWRAVGAHSRAMGRARSLRCGWASICDAALSVVTATVAVQTIADTRKQHSLSRWQESADAWSHARAMLTIGTAAARGRTLREALARMAIACQSRMRLRQAIARADLAARFMQTRHAIRQLRRTAQRTTQHSFLRLLGQSTVNREPPSRPQQQPPPPLPPYSAASSYSVAPTRYSVPQARTPGTSGRPDPPFRTPYMGGTGGGVHSRAARGYSSTTGVSPSPAFLQSVWKRAV